MVAKAPEYLVSHGKTGALGCFVASSACFVRGERVVLQGDRGQNAGDPSRI